MAILTRINKSLGYGTLGIRQFRDMGYIRLDWRGLQSTILPYDLTNNRHFHFNVDN